MQNENLFQVFSQVFIQSQQTFSKCDVELRTKCRTLSEKLSKLVDELENDAFTADFDLISSLEEDALHIMKSAAELQSRREFIKNSVDSLKSSTENRLVRRI
mgnify:CR=1 FL=1